MKDRRLKDVEMPFLRKADDLSGLEVIVEVSPSACELNAPRRIQKPGCAALGKGSTGTSDSLVPDTVRGQTFAATTPQKLASTK